MDRRDFFKTTGAGLTAAAVVMSPGDAVLAQNADAVHKTALDRIASNSYPIRSLFKSRVTPTSAPASPAQPSTWPANLTPPQMKEKYGTITMLDFPQFTKDTFPGVTRMDLFSSLFGDVSDDTMFLPPTDGRPGDFDPLSASGRKWIDTLANTLVKTGTKVQHISNNAPNNLAAFGSPEQDALRKAGVETAKRWLKGCAPLGVKSMRMNSPRALGPSIRPNAIPHSPGDGYPRNLDIVPLMAAAIESYKEMADAGGELGIRVTLENHWGLAADPMNIRTIIDEVNHPYCEASPDFGNWEHEYMLFNGIKALAPYSHTNVHAKYWDRWGDKNDVQRSTRIMLAAGFKGTFALEYEQGPLNGVEGAKYLYKEVLAALTTPIPVIGEGDLL